MPKPSAPKGKLPAEAAKDLAKALANIDWQQVVGNGGPPCFFVENGRFCLRAQRWGGHSSDFHYYVSLEDLVRAVSTGGAK